MENQYFKKLWAWNDILIAGLVKQTRFFKIDSTSVEEVFSDSLVTIDCSIFNNYFCRITQSKIMLHTDSIETPFMIVKSDLIIAACSTNNVILTCSGKDRNVLTVYSSQNLEKIGEKLCDHEISLISAFTILERCVAAITFWDDNNIVIYDIKSFEQLGLYKLDDLPRSLLFRSFEKLLYLVISTGNGNFVTYTLNSAFECIESKSISMGVKPVNLVQFNEMIVGCGDQPFIVHFQNGRLNCSFLDLKVNSFH